MTTTVPFIPTFGGYPTTPYQMNPVGFFPQPGFAPFSSFTPGTTPGLGSPFSTIYPQNSPAYYPSQGFIPQTWNGWIPAGTPAPTNPTNSNVTTQSNYPGATVNGTACSDSTGASSACNSQTGATGYQTAPGAFQNAGFQNGTYQNGTYPNAIYPSASFQNASYQNPAYGFHTCATPAFNTFGPFSIPSAFNTFTPTFNAWYAPSNYTAGSGFFPTFNSAWTSFGQINGSNPFTYTPPTAFNTFNPFTACSPIQSSYPGLNGYFQNSWTPSFANTPFNNTPFGIQIPGSFAQGTPGGFPTSGTPTFQAYSVPFGFGQTYGQGYGWSNPGWSNPGWSNPGWSNLGWSNLGWSNPGPYNQFSTFNAAGANPYASWNTTPGFGWNGTPTNAWTATAPGAVWNTPTFGWNGYAPTGTFVPFGTPGVNGSTIEVAERTGAQNGRRPVGINRDAA